MKIKINSKSMYLFVLIVTILFGLVMLTSLIIMTTAFVEPSVKNEIKVISIIAAALFTLITYHLMIILIEHHVEKERLK